MVKGGRGGGCANHSLNKLCCSWIKIWKCLGRNFLSSVEWCAVESAAKYNRNYTVHILTTNQRYCNRWLYHTLEASVSLAELLIDSNQDSASKMITLCLIFILHNLLVELTQSLRAHLSTRCVERKPSYQSTHYLKIIIFR